MEGIPNDILLQVLQRAGVTCQQGKEESPRRQITKLDLFQAGLSGRDNSAQLRQRLLKELDLPERLTVNALVPVLNAVCTYEEFQQLVRSLQGSSEQVETSHQSEVSKEKRALAGSPF